MRTLNPIFIIITLLACIALYSCKTAKPDPCDCNLPKNLEKIIDDITVEFDDLAVIFDEYNRDSSRIVNIIHFKYNDSQYISISASSLSDKEYCESFCFYDDILILYTKLDQDIETLFYSDCNHIPSHYRIYGITENLPEYYDPFFNKMYLIEKDNFKEVPDESINLTNIFIEKGMMEAPPPPPIE